MLRFKSALAFPGREDEKEKSMKGKPVKQRWPEMLSPEDRIAEAKEKTRKIVDHLLHVIAVHESNRALLFSDTLAKQVPPSHAAHAFNLLCDNQYRYELVRLCALWDPSKPDRESIPTIAALVDSDAVRTLLAEETQRHWVQLPARVIPSDEGSDDEVQKLAESIAHAQSAAFGVKQAQKALHWLKSAKRMETRVRRCDRYLALVDSRDRYIAHNLSFAAARKAPLTTAKYGDDSWLLALSIRIIDRLYLGICGANFDWNGSQKIAEKRALNFWNGVSLKVLG